MKLRDATDKYIAWRRAHGAKFSHGTKLPQYVPENC